MMDMVEFVDRLEVLDLATLDYKQIEFEEDQIHYPVLAQGHTGLYVFGTVRASIGGEGQS